MAERTTVVQNANLAKITRPRVDGMLLRTSLFSKLDALRKKPVIWVAGPGGSGKTTLVTSYIEQRNLPCLWYQIDDGDSDLATFFYYLGLAGKKVAPHRQKSLPFFTPEYSLGIPGFSRNFFAELFTYLQQQCVVVFDNYQGVEEDCPLHDVLLEGLTRMPEGMNLIFISRTTAPPNYSRLKANRLMDTLDWYDLRLSEKEFKKILDMRCIKKVPREIMLDIYKQLDGWVAGLHLLIETASPDHFEALRYIIEGTPEEIFDYFSCEIFERHDEDTRDFLLKTALLPFATPEMANKVSGHSDASTILSMLNRKNHFTVKRTEPIISYQFHPLFQKFLQQRAEKTYSRRYLIGMKHMAATVLIESKQTEQAVRLLQAAGDWEPLSSLILSQAPLLVRQGRNILLASWIKSIPETVISETPWLIYWLAMARMPFAPHESKTLFEEAFHLFKKKDDRAGLFLAWSGVADSINFCFTKFDEYDRWFEVFEEIKEKYGPYPSLEIEVRMTTSVFKAIVLRQPFHKDYETWLNRVAKLVETDIEMATRLQMFHILCASQIFAHNFIKAEFFIQSFKSYVNSSSVPPMANLMELQWEAFYLWLTARFDDCNTIIAKALKIGEEFGIHLFDHFLLNYSISAALSQGDVEGAQLPIEKILASIDHMNDWAKSYFYSQMNWLYVLKGDWEQAMFYADKGHHYSSAVGIPTIHGLKKTWLAFIHHNLGNYQESDQYLAESEALYNKIGLESTHFNFYLHKAYIDLERGREKKGLAALEKCFLVARKYGYVNSLHWNATVIAKLCAKALEEDIEVEYVRYLIQKRGLLPIHPSSIDESWPWPIKIYTLGRFSLVLNDKPLIMRGKAQQKPLAMLKLLLSFRGREVKEEMISYPLWPDADGDMAHQSFNSTLHRLRKLLGHKKALRLQDGKLSLDQRFCWVDTWAFERLQKEAEKESVNKSRLFEKAMNLYQGQFLPEDSDEFWSITMRERLRSKFLRNTCRFARQLKQEKEWNRAVDVLNKGLDVDNLAEEFYQGLMTCYQELGRLAEAVSVYKRCRKTLALTLGVEPSAQTEKIYRSLSCQ
ncbi:MAG: BTAD domain-containing putative transcriptional regulator [Thermodesulfobacteriota bacterium]